MSQLLFDRDGGGGAGGGGGGRLGAFPSFSNSECLESFQKTLTNKFVVHLRTNTQLLYILLLFGVGE